LIVLLILRLKKSGVRFIIFSKQSQYRILKKFEMFQTGISTKESCRVDTRQRVMTALRMRKFSK